LVSPEPAAEAGPCLAVAGHRLAVAGTATNNYRGRAGRG